MIKFSLGFFGKMNRRREGIDEMFTINKLGLPKTLRRCL